MKTSVDSAAVSVAEVAGTGSVGSPPLVPPGASAIGTEELVTRYREALWRIGTVCTNHVKPYTCRDEGSGKTIDAQYGADRWCEACIAADALRIPLPWKAGQVAYMRFRVRMNRNSTVLYVDLPNGENLAVEPDDLLTAEQVAEETR